MSVKFWVHGSANAMCSFLLYSNHFRMFDMIFNKGNDLFSRQFWCSFSKSLKDVGVISLLVLAFTLPISLSKYLDSKINIHFIEIYFVIIFGLISILAPFASQDACLYWAVNKASCLSVCFSPIDWPLILESLPLIVLSQILSSSAICYWSCCISLFVALVR